MTSTITLNLGIVKKFRTKTVYQATIDKFQVCFIIDDVKSDTPEKGGHEM